MVIETDGLEALTISAKTMLNIKIQTVEYCSGEKTILQSGRFWSAGKKFFRTLKVSGKEFVS